MSITMRLLKKSTTNKTSISRSEKIKEIAFYAEEKRFRDIGYLSNLPDEYINSLYQQALVIRQLENMLEILSI